MEKMDRRVRRTRRLLGQALLQLIQEKSYDAITIRDITERADIGYATFFRHYDSKEDLLGEQLAQLVRGLEEIAGVQDENYFQREGALFFNHVQANETLFQSLLGGHVNMQVVRQMRDSLRQVIQPHMAQNVKERELRFPLEIAANHMAAAALQLVAWWLENDMPYPAEEMGRIYQRLIVEATWESILS